MPTPHHGASHELALLERFVGDSVRQLPALPAAVPHQLPPRCSSHYASCSAMLREVLGVLAPLSPQLCHLVSQVWDLTSINFFVLLQLAQASLDEKDAVHAKWRQLQRFCEETTEQHAQRVSKYEHELQQARVASCELRAELQKTRQKANRLGVENAQLRKAVGELTEMNESLHGRIDGHAVAIEKLDDAVVHVAAMSSTEEWDLYGVSTEELERLDVVHPMETCAQDFDQLFEGLFERSREQMAMINEMDRFMNSNVISLLWRHGPDEDNTRFLQQMVSRRTTGTQTDDDELGILNDDFGLGSSAPMDNGDDGADLEDGDNNDKISGETGTATVVTKRQLLPPSLRAQLTTRPKIQRVLEKDHLSHLVLLLLLDKMESDGVSLRMAPKPQPRVPLHRFMKEFFLERYGIVTLGEYRMMEFVKSLVYYHEKHESEVRRLRLITGNAQSQQADHEPSSSASSTSRFSLVTHHDLAQLTCDDLRIALFTRLCELVPLQWGDRVAPAAGNLFACAVNALLDFLGDVIELDRSCTSLRDVVERRPASDWELPLEDASTLVVHHFSHCPQVKLELLRRRLSALVTEHTGSGSRPSDSRSANASGNLLSVTVDALLVFFVTQWFELDQQLTAKLHDTFHREVAVLQHKEREAPPTPMETLRRVWRSLPGEHLSLHDLDDLEQAFETILETRQSQQQRRVSKRQSVLVTSGGGVRPGSGTATVSARQQAVLDPCVGGISEKDFVFQTQQILRVRRVCRGLRTHGRCVVVPASDRQPHYALGPQGKNIEISQAAEEIASDELKPPY